MHSTGVVWLRRDLRLYDNLALSEALNICQKLVLVFIWTPKEDGQFQPGRSSRWWLHQSLASLQKQVEDRGGYVCYRDGHSAVGELRRVCQESGATAVFYNHLYDPISLVRDLEVKNQLEKDGIVVKTFNSEGLIEPREVVQEDGSPYTDFDSYWRKVTQLLSHSPIQPQMVDVPHIPMADVACLSRKTLDDLSMIDQSEMGAISVVQWRPGFRDGLCSFAVFLDERLSSFSSDRAKIDRDSTSKLSPHIHYGEISVRVMYHELRNREQSMRGEGVNSHCIDDFIRQLGYREYSRYLSFHFPFVHERSILEHIRAVPWVHCPMRFKAWKQGQTGYPIVDAAMRQLSVSGWLHNRSRVVAASFLVKNLLLPWQWGLKYFWDMLLDADLECDILGWQYVAGCLLDGHAFTYMLDFDTESRRFDPNGTFVRQWIPEIARLPTGFIHKPWTAPPDVLKKAGVVLDETYPRPIIHIHESTAAVQHAYGIVQKCLYTRTLRTEPFLRPSYPVAVKLLEPEAEVEQVITTKTSQEHSRIQVGQTGATEASAFVKHSTSGSGAFSSVSQQRLPPQATQCSVKRCAASLEMWTHAVKHCPSSHRTLQTIHQNHEGTLYHGYQDPAHQLGLSTLFPLQQHNHKSSLGNLPEGQPDASSCEAGTKTPEESGIYKIATAPIKLNDDGSRSGAFEHVRGGSKQLRGAFEPC